MAYEQLSIMEHYGKIAIPSYLIPFIYQRGESKYAHPYLRFNETNLNFDQVREYLTELSNVSNQYIDYMMNHDINTRRYLAQLTTNPWVISKLLKDTDYLIQGYLKEKEHILIKDSINAWT